MQCRPPIYIVCVLDNASRIIPVARTLVFDEHATHNLLACSLITGDVIQEGIVLFWRIRIAALGFGVEEADGTRLQSDDEIHIETTFSTPRILIRHGEMLFSLVSILVPPLHIFHLVIQPTCKLLLGSRCRNLLK